MLILQGYGHIGRETARLLKAFNVEVIVANSNGERREDDGVSSGARWCSNAAMWRLSGSMTRDWATETGAGGGGMDLGLMHRADEPSTSFPAQATRTVSRSHSACMVLPDYLLDLIVDPRIPSNPHPLAHHAPRGLC